MSLSPLMAGIPNASEVWRCGAIRLFRKPARTQRGHCHSIVNMYCIENLAGATFRNHPAPYFDVLASILLACHEDLMH
jgi:hypothetical protein